MGQKVSKHWKSGMGISTTAALEEVRETAEDEGNLS